MSGARFVSDEELKALLAAEPVVVVDCTATWCGPCRKIAPLIDQLADTYSDRATVVKVDIDQSKATATEYSIRSIPAVLFFKGSELASRQVGVAPYEVFQDALDKLL